MVKHRGFTLQRFLTAIGEQLFQDYLRDRGAMLADGASVVGEAPFQQFLDGLDDQDQQAILEDFQCINDVADRGKDLLEEAKQHYGIETPADEPRERTAMRLFLQHRDGAFARAYESYRYKMLASRLQHFQLPDQQPGFGAENVERFRSDIKRFYEDQSKGEGCLVRHRQERDGKDVLLLLRGDHITTESVWKEGAPTTDFFRKAKEEVLIYNPQNAILSLKVVGRNEPAKRKYVEAFCQCFLGMDQVDNAIFSTQTVSLAPIQTGHFNYNGNGQIQWVRLAGVALKLPEGAASTTVNIMSTNVLAALQEDIRGLSLRDGTLVSAHLRFKLDYDGRSPKPITVELHANGHTDLPKKREADIIEQYLNDNGVLLGGRATPLPIAAA